VNEVRTLRPLAVAVGVAQRIAVFAAVLAAWQIVTWAEVVPRNLLPAPADVLATLVDLLLRRGLLVHLGASVRRVVFGVAFGVTLAVPVGFALGWYPAVRRFFDPLINFMRALPPIALAPLVVVYLGIGESARIVVLVYAAFFAATVVTYEGISGLEPVYVRAARTLGANGVEIFFRVVLPQSLPHILTAFRVALGVSWATLVAAELVAAQQGLGAMIQNASNFFQIPVIFVGIIMIGLAALLMDQVLRVGIARLVSWRETV
jgi:NitT/TauT family transport system permease protein